MAPEGVVVNQAGFVMTKIVVLLPDSPHLLFGQVGQHREVANGSRQIDGNNDIAEVENEVFERFMQFHVLGLAVQVVGGSSPEAKDNGRFADKR